MGADIFSKMKYKAKHRKNLETAQIPDIPSIPGIPEDIVKFGRKSLSKCICHRHCLSRFVVVVGQVMFSRHSDQMSERSKVSNIAL